ncbi:MAG: hypothetical protein WCG48_00125 [Candidatus Berkelbacteria bacterium]
MKKWSNQKISLVVASILPAVIVLYSLICVLLDSGRSGAPWQIYFIFFYFAAFVSFFVVWGLTAIVLKLFRKK